ncbi:MAG: hypothetical protein ACRDCW_08680 [Sarcina sp.]
MLLGIQNLIEYLNRVYFKDENIEEEVEHMTKTLYDQEVERKGIEKGMEKGIEKGIEKGKIEAAKAILDVFDNEEIARRLGISVDIVKKIREEANNYKHPRGLNMKNSILAM